MMTPSHGSVGPGRVGDVASVQLDGVGCRVVEPRHERTLPTEVAVHRDGGRDPTLAVALLFDEAGDVRREDG